MIRQTLKRFLVHSGMRPLDFAILAILAVAACPLAADEVAVPDIETRIKSSGGSIPPAAVPTLESPKPLPIPETARREESPAVTEPPAPATEGSAKTPPGDVPADERAKSGIHGSASLGAGSPALLSGSLSIFRERAEGPGFALSFSHDSADGYGKEETGSGFFDRATSAHARVSGAFLSGDSSLSIGVSERSDGFQGKNPDYYAMTRRALDWEYSFARSTSLMSDWNLLTRIGITGRIDHSFAERPSGGPAPSAEIADYAGFGFLPAASIGFSRKAFAARLEGTFSYDSVADQDPGESKSGTVAIVGSYATRAIGSGSLTAEARVGAIVESGSDPLVPFDCSLSFESRSAFVRSLSLSGGLSADRQDPFALSSLEPFARLSGTPYRSADWNAKGAGTVPVSGPLLLGVGAEWRSTAYGRGILVLADATDPATALVPIEYRERDSFATRAALEWSMPGIAGTAGVSDEWMDGLDREALHALEGSVTLFDRSGTPRPAAARESAPADRTPRWEATARARIPLDSGDYPFLGASGCVRPIPAFACTLEVADILPLATGHLRERSGLYAERSGTVTLSGRLDF